MNIPLPVDSCAITPNSSLTGATPTILLQDLHWMKDSITSDSPLYTRTSIPPSAPWVTVSTRFPSTLKYSAQSISKRFHSKLRSKEIDHSLILGSEEFRDSRSSTLLCCIGLDMCGALDRTDRGICVSEITEVPLDPFLKNETNPGSKNNNETNGA